MAFIFADLIVLPIVAAYRKYYGTNYALRITALMFVTMVLAALIIDLVFSALGLIPANRPTSEDIFSSVQLDYKLVLNVIGVVIFGALFALTVRRGATDPVCGMRVDKATAFRVDHDGRRWFFCSEHCKTRFESDPDKFAQQTAEPVEARVADHVH
jgi:hypothetical protein